MNMPFKWTKGMVRQLRRDNLAWPLTLKSIPRDKWPHDPFNTNAVRQEVLRSRDFLVQVFEERGHIRLSINRTDFDVNAQRFREDISWDDIQRLKVEAGFGDWWAVECYPPPSQVVNVANMRHIWVLNEPPPFGWAKG